MKVRWIGDARVIAGVGMPIAGEEYDWPDAMAESLIEQGKAERVSKPVVSRSVPRNRWDEED